MASYSAAKTAVFDVLSYGVGGYAEAPPGSERGSGSAECSMKIGPPSPACDALWYHSRSGASADGVKMKKVCAAAGCVPMISGTRAAADGTFPSNWYPTKPPKDDMTRPASASSGIKFEKQITRKQDVNGKLLEDIPMTRFLFGAK